MMWERAADLALERGQELLLDRQVTEVAHENGRVKALTASGRGGNRITIEADHFLSSMPLRDLVEALRPPPPAEVVEAAQGLRYRDFLTVGLIIADGDLFPDNWIYIHSPEVRVGRVQNFKNWSPEMVPDPNMTCLGLEYFVWEGDELWRTQDRTLVELGAEECDRIGLTQRKAITDGVVVRMHKAYPVYDQGYAGRIDVVRRWLAYLTNLQCIGRNGQHRYNNADHSMMTAMLAVRNVLGEKHDIWDVNVDSEYHETSTSS
jgi:protoporphyrinogen oxidase